METNLPNNMNPMTFDDWVETFLILFGQEQMKLHPSEVFIRFSEAGGKIAEDIRRDRYHQALGSLSECFCAAINMYNRLARDPQFKDLFEEVYSGLGSFIFERFPYHCPHCGGDHCICAIKFADSENRTREEIQVMKNEIEDILIDARATSKKPEKLDDYVHLFKSVYGQGHQYMSIDVICFHLLEEIGETAEALRILLNYSGSEELSKEMRDAYLREFADVTSWICALLRKIEYQIRNASRGYEDQPFIPTLSELLKMRYLQNRN